MTASLKKNWRSMISKIRVVSSKSQKDIFMEIIKIVRQRQAKSLPKLKIEFHLKTEDKAKCSTLF